MTDPKRQKIYIAIIAVCVLGAIGILMFGMGGSGGNDSSVIVNTPASGVPARTQVSPTGKKTYAPPAVFPHNPRFESAVLESSVFQSMTAPTPVSLTEGELGRENPFQGF